MLKSEFVNTDIIHIITQKFKNCITEEELQILNQWLNASEENREKYTELEKIWIITGQTEQEIEVNEEEEWRHFLELRENSKQSSKTSVISLKSAIFRYAAVIVTIVCISLALKAILVKNKTPWESIVTSDSKRNITLSDGTVIRINKYSELSFPKTFDSRKRVVKLNGEAYFEVAKAGSPFIVDAGKTMVEVLGTKFNVNNYHSDTLAHIFVEEGKVLFKERTARKNVVILQKGEKGVFKGHRLPIQVTKETGILLNTWHSTSLIFDNCTLEEAAADLENYFSKEIIVSETVAKARFSGVFSEPELDNILDIMGISTSTSYYSKGNTIYIEAVHSK